MLKYIKSVVIVLIGVGVGLYLNDLNTRLQSEQAHDYLHMSTNTNWILAIVFFSLMLSMVVVGYYFGKKVNSKEI